MAAERPDKKEKKDKKRSDEAGISKAKKDKKDKKEKKDRLVAALDEKLQQDAALQDSDVEATTTAITTAAATDSLPLERTVVPFAVPIADDKGMKKVYKAIRKGACALPQVPPPTPEELSDERTQTCFLLSFPALPFPSC